MDIQEIISKKRDNKELTKEEISYFISKYTEGTITDYQAAALIMAIYINGMSKQETVNLAFEMSKSGDILDLSTISNNVIDKHSTGGVGDKITLILMPIIASLNIPVAKMSGRGLGFTGGTIDKLESVPGYKTEISIEEFINNVKKVGISIIGQTANLAPADKKIYALRDSINCVGNMPLIASSIMSKKIAAGANKIVLDVTVGKGAFMKNKKEATILAKMMKGIGELAGRETVCILTNMNEPVGYTIGNVLEIKETIECLKGNMPKDIEKIVTTIGSYIIKLHGINDDLIENKKMIIENIKNGKAFNKFLELIQNQGGDIEYIKHPEKLEKAKYIIPVISDKEGFVKELNAEQIGQISVRLGAGRVKKEDSIDKAVGIVLDKKISSKVSKGDVLAYIYANNKGKGEIEVEKIKQAYKIVKEPVENEDIILGVI